MRTSGKLVSALELAIKKRSSAWKRKYGDNLLGVRVGEKEKGGIGADELSIVFHVESKQVSPARRIPPHVRITLSDGSQLTIESDVIEVGTFKLQQYSPGTDISEAGHNSYGSLAAAVKRGNDTFILSCMHVLGPSYLSAGLRGRIKPPVGRQVQIAVKPLTQPTIVGAFIEGIFTNGIDAAIAYPQDPHLFSNALSETSFLQRIYLPSDSDIYNRHLTVALKGAASGLVVGKLLSKNVVNFITHPGGGRISFANLYASTRMSSHGDSGAILFDDQRRAISMVIGSDNRFTYSIPLSDIFIALQIHF